MMAPSSSLDLPVRCGSIPDLHLPESNAESSNRVFLVAVLPVSSGLNDVKKSLAEVDILPKPFQHICRATTKGRPSLTHDRLRACVSLLDSTIKGLPHLPYRCY